MSQLIDQAKNMIHETVKTDEQRQAEQANKPIAEKIQDNMPGSATEAGAKLDAAASNAKAQAEDAASKAQETAEEKRAQVDKAGSNLIDDIKGGLGDLQNATGQKIKEVREQIADATKPVEKQ